MGLFSNLNSIAQDNFLSNSEGSSIQAENSDINKLDNVDGCLIGGSSLKIDEFNLIISWKLQLIKYKQKKWQH